MMQSLLDRTRTLSYAQIETEKRLKSLSMYADLFASAADGMVATDTNGQLLFANPRAHEIVGMSGGNLFKRKARTFY
ncbi:MAG: PAS domain S-box protein [Myxococcales bacterium]|nr:MAG: PAS domain S-box protein [Myxococcales bacterium]